MNVARKCRKNVFCICYPEIIDRAVNGRVAFRTRLTSSRPTPPGPTLIASAQVGGKAMTMTTATTSNEIRPRVCPLIMTRAPTLKPWTLSARRFPDVFNRIKKRNRIIKKNKKHTPPCRPDAPVQYYRRTVCETFAPKSVPGDVQNAYISLSRKRGCRPLTVIKFETEYGRRGRRRRRPPW